MPAFGENLCCANHCKQSSGDEFSAESSRKHYAPDLIIQSRHIKICLNFNLSQYSLDARVIHTFHRIPSSFAAAKDDLQHLAKSIELNAVDFQNIRVKSLTADCPVSFEYTGKLLKLAWDKSFAGGEERQVEIAYSVVRPVAGMFFSHPKVSNESDSFVYAITDHETERARYWLPCVDYPSSRTTLEFELTCPKHMIALANGQLIREEERGNEKTAYWRLDNYQCPSYLICVAVGEFERVQDTPVDGIPIEYFAPVGFPPADIKRAFDKTPSMISWLQTKLQSKFPWPKYFQIASPGIHGGAMENISLVTWSHRFLMDELWAKEFKLAMDTVNIHEMAHTYFGDLIVIRHFDQVWLKESWATYMESVWIEEHLSRQDFQFEMFENAESYFAETERYMRPLVTRKYESSWSLFDSHTYPGGCWRIHQLRGMLGDRVFWEGVARYVSAYRDKVVETADFRKIFESESGLNLTRYFDEWYYGKGFPKLKASHEYDKDSGRVTVTLEQTQVDAKAEVFLFHVDFEVCVTDEKGQQYTGKVCFNDGRHFADNKAWTSIPIGQHPPVTIQIDPEAKLLFQLDFNPGLDMLGQLASRSTVNVPNRIRAVRELIKVGSYAAIGKVREAVKKEKFYGVRAYAAAALGESRTRYAIDLLADMLLWDSDPMSMWRVAKATVGIKDSRLREALLTFLQRSDLAYRAQAYALESLGYQADERDLEYLLKTAADPLKLGYHNIVRCGALRALGHHQSKESFEYLFDRVSNRKEPQLQARAAAIESLARSASWQDTPVARKKTIRQLTAIVTADHLNEPNRKAAIAGLIALEASNSAQLVWESRSLFAEQDWPWLQSKCDALRSAGKGAGVAVELKKRVEQLEEQVRKLQQQQQEKPK